LLQIALFLYEDMTALDAVGPYEVLARLPDTEVKFVASTPGPKKTDVGLVLTADSSLDDVPAPDVIVIPGSGKVPFLDDPAQWSGSAKRTTPRSGRPPSVRARYCSVPPECSQESARPPIGPFANTSATSAPSRSQSAS